MLFNSIEFLLFLPVVFAIYWSLRNSLRLQNLLIVLASYLFYGWWDWRFLFLIAFTTVCSYYSGLLIDRNKSAITGVGGGNKVTKAKFYCVCNIVINIAILGLFKYYNFFAESFVDICQIIGWSVDMPTLKLILPVGISFYTFQALSYTIDVYRGKINVSHDIVAFMAFISFFPQLVAGPIERATNLYPQFIKKRSFDYTQAVEGSKLILWGFFKKIVIADSATKIVDLAFGDIEGYNSTSLLIGAVMFSFQIYGDFSGYSDIAIGVARLFGIRLMKNFNLPYLSRNIAEFWKRWHISLNTWFVDYVYIPLGGSRVSKLVTLRNTFVIFLLSGLWHGANWTYVAWGLYHALLFVPLLIMGKQKRFSKYEPGGYITPMEIFNILATFALATLGWVVFRSSYISQAWTYVCKLFTLTQYGMPAIIKDNGLLHSAECFLAIVFLIIIEYKHRGEDVVLNFKSSVTLINWSGYLIVALWTFIFYTVGQAFIYFQF